MGAAIVGRVQGKDVAGMNVALVQPDDGFDRAVHRTEMNRHMRRVGDELAIAGKDRAGEVEPLLDIDRIGGVLQRHAHLLGDRHEQIIEDFEHDRVGVGAERAPLGQRHGAGQHHVVSRRQFRLPARLDDDGLMGFDDQTPGRRSWRPASNRRADRCRHRARRRRNKSASSTRDQCGVSGRYARPRLGSMSAPSADGLDLDALDQDRLALEDETELAFGAPRSRNRPIMASRAMSLTGWRPWIAFAALRAPNALFPIVAASGVSVPS